MGALHAGHAALLRRARALAGTKGTVVASIFVNPTQFGPKEDLSRYPRPFSKDKALCKAQGTDLLFAPAPNAVYPADFSTWVDESSVGLGLCGGTRPGHFRGVCTVVLKLLQICQPSHAVFGRKDFQQCAVIARMVRDLNVPVRLVFEQTVRESDGLALSSRNAYLLPEERAQAVVLHQALQEARTAARGGVRSIPALRRVLEKRLASAPLARPDYIALVDQKTLQPLRTLTPGCVAALAVFFGKTRLIDNMQLL
jgi:pantoate--beta-alanine ligase